MRPRKGERGFTVLDREGGEGLSDGETSGQRGACECGCVGNGSLLCKGPEGSGCGEKQQGGQRGWSRGSGGKAVREEVRGSSGAQLTHSPASHCKETGFYSQWDEKPLQSSEQRKNTISQSCLKISSASGAVLKIH